VSPAANGTSGRALRGDRLLEVIAVILLGVATVGSAWCGYQATRWNKEESDAARRAGEASLEASRQFGLATQIVSYDSNMVAQYAQAKAAGNERLLTFFRETLIRPEFRNVLDEWEAQIDAGQTPTNLLEDQDYVDEQMGPFRDAEQRVAAEKTEADEASENTDGYVLTTLLLATALFFAGVTGSFRMRWLRFGLLSASAIIIAVAAARLADLPTA
jgi:hypothetical protein